MGKTRNTAAAGLLRPAFALLVICVLAEALAAAQTLTGTLSGTVKDEQGGVLAGAKIRLTSPSLIGGPLETTSSDKGQWRFLVLPSGVYSLTIELAPKFKPHREDAIRIGAGMILERPIVLTLSGVVSAVTVEASPGDLKASGLEVRRGYDFIDSIPSRRYSMFDLFRGVPGVSPTSPSSSSVNTLSVYGSAVNENLFLIDGTNFTCPCQGVSRAEPSIDIIQEAQVQTTGASVEYGNAQGGVFNIVTKQGGARYEYDASYYGQPAGLTAQPIRLAAPILAGTQTGFERIRYRDFTTNLGGPAKRDRVWFFAGYQYLRDYDSQPGADPAQPRKYEQNKGFGKVTSRLTPSLQMMQSLNYESWVNPQVPTRTVPFIATSRTNATVPAMTFANVTHALSNNTVWEARIGRFIVNQNNDPSSNDRLTPPHIDSVTNVVSQNAQTLGTVRFDRVTGKAVLHHFKQDWLSVDHKFRFGTQIERGQHVATQAFPGGEQFLDANSAPSQKLIRSAWTLGGRFNTMALFASDSVALHERVTAEMGLRYDYSHAISQDLAGVTDDGLPTDGFTPGAGSLYTWHVFSPRLGLTARLSADGRTMLRANYGRFSQGVLTGELDPIHPGVSPVTRMQWNAATGEYSTLISIVDPNSNLTLDPDTRAPHTDEYSFALDRQIRSNLTASVAYIAKRGSDSIGWNDIGGSYAESTTTLPDGTVLPIHRLTNGTAARLFELTNPDSLFLEYDGFVVAMEKRLSKGWQASGSYTFSRTYGTQVTSNAVVSEGQFSTVARPATLTFGQDPNDLTNAVGRLLNDRPHIFRTTGVVHLPWQGVVVAANLQHFSGKPWMATAQVNLPQNPTQRIMIEPRGARRLSSQSLLDLRISKTLRIGSTSTVDLRMDMLNLLNDTAEEALATDVLFNAAGVRQPTFGTSNVFMDPRRVMFSVRLNLGR